MTFKKLTSNDIWSVVIAVLLSIISFFEVMNYTRWDNDVSRLMVVNRRQDSILIRQQLIYELQLEPTVKRSFDNETAIGKVKADVETLKSKIK